MDESYLCDRNTSVYEIPLAFESYNGDILDLRRLVYAPSGEKHYLDMTSGKGINNSVLPGVVRGQSHAQVFGGTTYYITIDSTDVNNNFILYPMFVSSTEPIIVCIKNSSGSIKNLTLSNSANGYTLNYDWVDSWQTNTYGTYTELVSGTSKILVLFPVKITMSGATFGVLTKGSAEGGSVDPDSVYTKQEINNLLAQKANTDTVNNALALKENISSLGALAYQNRVNYLTQIDNKPDQNNIIDVTYYVSKNNGNDGNLGTQESPFKTIQHAIDSVGINCIGTIIIASDTYTEKLFIKGKHVILKQEELPEESTNAFNTEILINPYSQQDYDEDYCIKIIDNSIAEFIGFFTIKAYHYGILISDNSCLFLDGKYFLRTVLSSNKYCTIKVDLNITPSGNGTPSDEIINPWDGNGVYVRNASNFITKSYNKVVISNLSNASEFAGYGFRIEKSYCFAYDTGFDHLYQYVYCYGGVFRYYQSDKEGYDNFEGDGVIKSLDFGSLAYKDTADYQTDIINKPNIPNIVNEYISNRKIYVDGIDGDDTTGNGSEENPYKTIQKAIDEASNNIYTEIFVTALNQHNNYVYEEGITISGKYLNIVTVTKPGFDGEFVFITLQHPGMDIKNNSKVILSGNIRFSGIFSIKISNNSCLAVCNKENSQYNKLVIRQTGDGSSKNSIFVRDNSKLSVYNDDFEAYYGDNATSGAFITAETGSNVYIKSLNVKNLGQIQYHDFSCSDSLICYGAYKVNDAVAVPKADITNGLINWQSTIQNS